MFNFGSFISISKNLLLFGCIALAIYGVSLLVKFILTKTNNIKVWDDYISKYWTAGCFVISSIIFWIIGATRHIDSSFVNGVLNGLILTGLEASMFRIIKIIVDFFAKIIGKGSKATK